jgi:hypothetical protein
LGRAPTSAVADIVTETYTGTVIGTDYAGYFGTAGLDLSNATFTATYVFDTNHITMAVISRLERDEITFDRIQRWRSNLRTRLM